mmetsp:Transcript_38497/g.83646  ORF Transcript_38497/g.83646 Transcript_38497/m.83646 type:complete len:111 (+) Transcript_38497:127-459(+)
MSYSNPPLLRDDSFDLYFRRLQSTSGNAEADRFRGDGHLLCSMIRFSLSLPSRVAKSLDCVESRLFGTRDMVDTRMDADDMSPSPLQPYPFRCYAVRYLDRYYYQHDHLL